MKNIWILQGEGIECEKESFRFFSFPDFSFRCAYLPIPEILKKPEKSLDSMKAEDWVIFPGGFSFADHLGSGRLLSFKFQEAKVFEKLFQKKVHLLGICNGFQILCAAQLFGDNVYLQHNNPPGFVNRWARLKDWKDQHYFFTCRHGEGRIEVEGALGSQVKILLKYADETFDNGSVDGIAGLVSKHHDSYVVGMMPHPEIALRAMDQADFVGPEHPGEFSARMEEKPGDGPRFIKALFQEIEGKGFR